jgi:DnaJ like chaperone protein
MKTIHLKARELSALENAIQVGGRTINFSDVEFLGFDSLVTNHSRYGRITEKTYSSRLFFLTEDTQFQIVPNTNIFGFTTEDRFLKFRNICGVIAQNTLEFRLEKYVSQLRETDFYSFGDIQISRSGDIFRNGVRFLQLSENFGSIKVDNDKIFFPIIENKNKISSSFLKSTVSLDLFYDRDCFYLLLQNVLGFTVKNGRLSKIANDKYFEYVIRIATHLIIADGKVRKSELEALKKIFSINEKTCPRAADIFNEEISNPTPLNETLTALLKHSQYNPQFVDSLVSGLFRISLADGELHKNEIFFLKLVFQKLDRTQLLQRLLAIYENKEGKLHRNSTELYQKILGVGPNSTKSDIKKAYKNLVKRHHPDKLQGAGVPFSEIAKSEELLRHINEAYSFLTG